MIVMAVLFVLPFPTGEYTAGEEPPMIRDTFNFGTLFLAQHGLMMSLMLLTSLLQAEHTQRALAHTHLDERVFMRTVGRFTWREFFATFLLGIQVALIMTVRLMVEMRTSILTAAVPFFIFYIVVLQSIRIVKVVILRRELDPILYLNKLKYRVGIVVIIQVIVYLYGMLLMFALPPIVGLYNTINAIGYSSGTIDPTVDACLLANKTFLATHCASTTVPSPFASAPMCDSGSWRDYRSVAAACVTFKGRAVLAFKTISTGLTSMLLPVMAVVLIELRRAQRLWTVWVAIGDVLYGFCAMCFAFFVSMVMLPTTIDDAMTGQVADLLGGKILPICSLACSLTTIFYSIDALQRELLRIAGKRPSRQHYAVFLSHDWGKDELGRSNHKRVVRLSEELKALGLRTWLDQDRMEGDINAAMSEGIDASETVAVFITSNYLVKAQGQGARRLDDNCYAEFTYALARKGVRSIIPCVMEPALRDTVRWHGVVGLRLGSQLYVDCSDDAGLATAAESIAQEVTRRTAKCSASTRESMMVTPRVTAPRAASTEMSAPRTPLVRQATRDRAATQPAQSPRMAGSV